ncbi:uncharacterized protein LOC779380 precursor [Xenopus laevis]|uniref:Uncharacterized protein LOC779380 precursor n=2 Tax=Xenopus laevis TaxID=8355 RepID=A0A8J0Q5V1_XENLA|nr:uncharacterized protein LOC779380 precursor [Xenopus laevis]
MACYISLVFLLCFPAVYSGSHMLQYYVTMLSTSQSGLPQYSITAYVDDVQYGRYTSDTRRCEPLFQSLMVLSKHLDIQTKNAQHTEITQRVVMDFIMDRLNKTYDNRNNHVYQRKIVCELHEDGTVEFYKEVALDGKELIVFDKERVAYAPATQEAVLLTQLWSKYYSDAKSDKLVMENECTQHMKVYISFIKSFLTKKVPHVKISSSESESGIKLHCRVYGFYPRDVEVKWIKNERDEIYSEESAEILPNPDGTYQIRVSVEVTPEEGATYSCHVDHSSLETIHMIPFERKTKDSNITYIVIAVAVAAALFLAFGLGFFIQRKRKEFKGSRQSVSTEEQD